MFLHRLSLNQLRALKLLAESQDLMADSSVVGIKMGVTGKPLGGLFSSLARQRINGESLVLAWGRTGIGRGLRWKLNEKVIKKNQLLQTVKEIL